MYVPKHEIMAENKGVIDPSKFFDTPPGNAKFNFIPESDALPHLKDEWTGFQQHLEALR